MDDGSLRAAKVAGDVDETNQDLYFWILKKGFGSVMFVVYGGFTIVIASAKLLPELLKLLARLGYREED